VLDLQLVDTHCHLTMDDFQADLEQVLEAARQAGLTRVLVPGMDLNSSQLAVQLSETFEEVYAAVGIHPHNAASYNEHTLEVLRSLSDNPKVIAIGEIGLDFYRNLSPREAQIECFRSQLSLAAEVDLPVVVHNRDAIDDILDILTVWREDLSPSLAQQPGVLHAYSADEAHARQAIALGFYLGIAGPITFKKAEELRTLVYNLPIECLLIETDSPYLAPEPKRGRRNEPANVSLIINKVAAVRSIEPATVARITTGNAEILFNWTD
jgi:TatD DNase family protein